jgi:2,3-bisphosphoglycerate-independent phosphoglycerate mutase
MKTKKVALLILDGWGIGNGSASDAIAHSQVPFYRSLLASHPHAQLKTFGENVGLPEGQMGNSEVGHMNIGAGRVVFQDLVRINKEVRENKMDRNPVLLKALQVALKENKTVHLMGLVSDGGVHSSQDHLHKLCDIAQATGLKKIFVHAFLDGRDTDPRSGAKFISRLQKHIQNGPVKIASLIGRYYAMDRDNRWERIKLAYDLLVHGKGEQFRDAEKAIAQSYAHDLTDEFVKPVVLTDEHQKPLATLQPGDVVICFNFRTDRCRELSKVLTQADMPDLGMHTVPLQYVTMTNYDESFQHIQVMYDKDNLAMTLGEVISQAGVKQIRIAETEKYPHVTFFFNGGREEEFKNERRILVPSPKVATYDLQPEMSAQGITQAILPEIEKGDAGFICLNFANADMVGHTGVFKAVQQAVETVDGCVHQIVDAGLKNGYSFIIIADHGNADYMINPDGSANTAHSLNPVPCILIDPDYTQLKDGKLADLAPTILTLMGIPIPKEMDGEVLIGK